MGSWCPQEQVLKHPSIAEFLREEGERGQRNPPVEKK